MKLRALVVDDSRIMRRMVMDAVSKTNVATFEFTEAEDGADALGKFDPSSIDIIFADWNMPKMSGIEFVHKVRTMRNTENIAILMVTSEKTMGKMEIALDKAGADDYVCKPFTVEEMQRKVARVMTKFQARAQQPAEDRKPAGGFFSKLMQGIN